MGRGPLSSFALALALLISGCGGDSRVPPGVDGDAFGDGSRGSLIGAGIPSPEGGSAVPGSTRLLRPSPLRGLYVNAWAAGSSTRSEALLDLARRTEVNAFVVDVKDASGYVSYSTEAALAKEVGADGEIRIRDVRSLLSRMEAAGVWPIARIVVFKDPLLAQARPDLAVQDSTGAPWVDGKGHLWVNPWDERVWDYHIELAREALELGFREIQWDYIRFPDRPEAEMAHARFPGSEGRERTEAVRGFLERARSQLAESGAPLTADVFGVTTAYARDVGIGQLWERFADVVDASLPMVYPSHYWPGSFGIEEPNHHPYEVVRGALEAGVRRNALLPGAGSIIPWLQDFTLGDPPYGVAEVRAQILAARDVGIHDWILWNASSRYTEGALRPVDGWPGGVPPLVRFGGRLVPEWPEGEEPPAVASPPPGDRPHREL